MIRSMPIAMLITSLFTAMSVAEPMDCVINPNSSIELGSHQDGLLEEVLVSRGDRVVKGQPLAKLDSEMEVMNAQLARIRAESDTSLKSSQVQADFRARELTRLESLRDNQSVSTSVYEQAEIEHNLAALSVESAELEQEIARTERDRAEAQLERRTIKSPVDGVVVDVVMAPGEYVHEQSTLMNLAALDPLYVQVYAPVAYYGQIQQGMAASVRPEPPVGGEYTATVAVVDQVFAAASRTFGIRLELPNTDLALPGGVRCMVEFEQGLNAVTADP